MGHHTVFYLPLEQKHNDYTLTENKNYFLKAFEIDNRSWKLLIY